ncbi:MAG TPA: ROK family glucokinase [Bacillus sp. (in: firmicutes)]|uniref:ROK family glucokinase n=1 Tax=Bacillus litorisediminis TaxID=2922713 RepID=UPI001FACA8A5|nr:ROK family glucokinase [Bacillus litorisediminis]HWO77632.1 ROK family glucokinase [Bacillus sp. (in: firmicutes)]
MNEKILIGIDLGGTTTKIGMFSEMGELLNKWEIPTDVSNNGKRIVPSIAKSIEEKLHDLHIEKKQVIGVGVGAPGSVHVETGLIFEAVNLGWKQFPLKAELEKTVGIRATIDNDANCAALGEMWMGAGKGSKDMVCVTLGTGVGGGVITNRQVVHGIKGAGGEIGHMTIVPENGFSCNCGKTGCLETVASATGIVRLAKQHLESFTGETLIDQAALSAKSIFEAAEKGDTLANQIVEKVAFYLGLALSHLGNTLNPEKIVIGGGVSRAGNTLLEPVNQYFRKFTFPTVQESTDLSIATLGNDAGIYGAAWLAQE